ncbi:hypothetical protein ALC62_08239 [Cyphomyrmex costatus]|uniref:Uncharacterized protein n=1 Tax=Cyphomyrmex costatus TaxID=456900 RepID=A0A195CJX3_9HYME|nr:hypothetical protein ALC62_08239 [Cyphomyrmex costatus]
MGPRWEHTRGQRVERSGPQRETREGEARPTAKDPNRRVNTLLTVRREARKPNGIRFGDLVGGLRRPPAATTASARSYPTTSLETLTFIRASQSIVLARKARRIYWIGKIDASPDRTFRVPGT